MKGGNRTFAADAKAVCLFCESGHLIGAACKDSPHDRTSVDFAVFNLSSRTNEETPHEPDTSAL